MGRPLFDGFLRAASRSGDERTHGLHWAGAFASWETLLSRGRARAALVRPQRAYLVDPNAGIEGFASFFAVATVPDTCVVWASASAALGPLRALAPGLYAFDASLDHTLTRSLWGILTSGSSGTPKLPVGYADTLELVALHYDAAVFELLFEGKNRPGTLATCLPLQFSAAFFMIVVPAIFLRRDLFVFAPHDWRPLCSLAQRESVLCLSVPSVATAGCLSVAEPVDLSRAALLLGAGYVTQERVRAIRSRFRNVALANIYGTAETGAISLDRDPGVGRHVGHPISGKPVWLENVNENGIGMVATTGPDCRSFYWTPGTPLQRVEPVVASTDYGHFHDGNLYLDGRIDAGEKLHGITIHPRLVERHILELDGVVDVRVLVVHDPGGRELLAARVVGRVDEDAVRDYCNALPEIQRPHRIECIAESDVERAYTAHGKL